MQICIIGLWHQGIVGAACLADLGCSVVAADHDIKKIELLVSGKAPLFEPGLDELIEKGLRSGRLTFSSDVAGSVKGCLFCSNHVRYASERARRKRSVRSSCNGR